MVRHHNTLESAHSILRKIAKSDPIVLQIQRELVDEHKAIIDTAAGDSINKGLKEQIKRHQAELKAFREDMRQALKAKDDEMKERMQERIEEMEKEAKLEREQAEAEYNRKFVVLIKRFQHTKCVCG